MGLIAVTHRAFGTTVNMIVTAHGIWNWTTPPAWICQLTTGVPIRTLAFIITSYRCFSLDVVELTGFDDMTIILQTNSTIKCHAEKLADLIQLYKIQTKTRYQQNNIYIQAIYKWKVGHHRYIHEGSNVPYLYSIQLQEKDSNPNHHDNRS